MTAPGALAAAIVERLRARAADQRQTAAMFEADAVGRRSLAEVLDEAARRLAGGLIADAHLRDVIEAACLPPPRIFTPAGEREDEAAEARRLARDLLGTAVTGETAR